MTVVEIPKDTWPGKVREITLGATADGGMKRVVWLSSNLRESMRPALEEVCEREGIPDLLDKIADETVATSVEELLPFLEEKGHPALTMDSLL